MNPSEERLAASDAAIRNDPSDADAHAGRGRALFALDRHEDAVEAFTEALRLRPGDPDFPRGRGKAHYENNDNETAIEDFDEVQRRRPGGVGNDHGRLRVAPAGPAGRAAVEKPPAPAGLTRGQSMGKSL